MKVNLFGTEIDIKDHHCNFNETFCRKVEDPYVNVYVRLTDLCNASCGFCEFHGHEDYEFNEYKLYYALLRLKDQVRINKLSFTGGEPTLDIDRFNRALKVVKEIDPNIFTIVNTNGCRWTEIDTNYVDSIALSVHHYNGETNDMILGSVGALTSDIRNFANKSKLHLSCNLIKGQIDSTEEAYRYISYWGERGVEDIGFVSLMKRNQYCKDYFVDFDSIELYNMPNTMRSQHWQQMSGGKVTCKCDNFLTFTESGNIVKSYARYYVDTTECKGMLVYDINKLKVGFNGPIIFE